MTNDEAIELARIHGFEILFSSRLGKALKNLRNKRTNNETH